jgi:dolichol-phosphate mannosyltransferase
MYKSKRIGVVIPAYKVKEFLSEVVLSLPEFIDDIIVVNDACPIQSYTAIDSLSKVNIIHLEKNQGVGGAVLAGYQEALKSSCDIVVKVDGDGQMDTSKIVSLIEPIIAEKADYTKGNRFRDFEKIKQMPLIRFIGNSCLSLIMKFVSGYWSIMDPTNGFTAVSLPVLKELNLNKIAKRYFFESDMLINLNIYNFRVKDIPIPAIYGDENSSMNIKLILLQFPLKLLKGFFKRITLKYLVLDFNVVFIFYIFSIFFLSFGGLFGLYKWIESIQYHQFASTGTVMLSVLPIILGVQLLLQAIQLDIYSEPK